MASEAEKKAEIERVLYARDIGESPILTALKEAAKELREERDRWWPFKPPWRRPKKPTPKTSPGWEKKKLPKPEKVDA